MLEDEDTGLMLGNVMKLWRACPVKRCRRAKTCIGIGNPCDAIFWPVLPEDLKVWWRVAIQARCDGCTERQSRRAADAAAENWRKQEALTKRPQVK